jgi:hypothetical protein
MPTTRFGIRRLPCRGPPPGALSRLASSVTAHLTMSAGVRVASLDRHVSDRGRDEPRASVGPQLRRRGRSRSPKQADGVSAETRSGGGAVSGSAALAARPWRRPRDRAATTFLDANRRGERLDLVGWCRPPRHVSVYRERGQPAQRPDCPSVGRGDPRLQLGTPGRCGPTCNRGTIYLCPTERR